MIIELIYFIAGLFFIFGIKQLTKVKTAKRGNLLASVGMFIAVAATIIHLQLTYDIIGWEYIISGVIIGSLIGALLAVKIKMTAMPQLVAIFNGFGGLASVLVALAVALQSNNGAFETTTVVLSILIGAVTFTGSIIAFSKLQGIISSKPLVYPGNQIVNGILFTVIMLLSFITISGTLFTPHFLLAVLIFSAILGILLTIPIGGADMPVVIALLNSYSGLAAAMAGFAIQNIVLIVSGSLVGASGLILTRIMCKAMNRSLANVMFGGFGQEVSTHSDDGYESITESSPEDTAVILENAHSVIIVPGYGLAVAQAQHAVQELSNELEKRKKTVKFAIHPVAGRMPGHMNVLLAEADVSYDKLYDLEGINSDFKNTDVVIVVGANDVVNPAAANDKGSPIYGMPILNVHEAGTVIVIKRSLSPGFAGIKNELFDRDNTRMVFMDAKKGLTDITKELKEL